MKHEKTDKRLHNVKIKYGKINIEDKKFILQILELLRECSNNPNRIQGENVKIS